MSGMTRLVNVQNRGRGGRQISTGFSLDQTSQVGEERSRLCSVILCNSVTKELKEYKRYYCIYIILVLFFFAFASLGNKCTCIFKCSMTSLIS